MGSNGVKEGDILHIKAFVHRASWNEALGIIPMTHNKGLTEL